MMLCPHKCLARNLQEESSRINFLLNNIYNLICKKKVQKKASKLIYKLLLARANNSVKLPPPSAVVADLGGDFPDLDPTIKKNWIRILAKQRNTDPVQ